MDITKVAAYGVIGFVGAFSIASTSLPADYKILLAAVCAALFSMAKQILADKGVTLDEIGRGLLSGND